MAEMTDRRILVFDGNGLISNVDRLSWKIKAIVAQEEREKVARRVRDNLRYLRRNGKLLGTIPQGYHRVDGRIVEDPAAAPAIKEIFDLYATGRFSFRSLAEHLTGAASGRPVATTRPTTAARRRSSLRATYSRTWWATPLTQAKSLSKASSWKASTPLSLTPSLADLPRGQKAQCPAHQQGLD
jgi:DNA invertase Pin-like site-specific DNA recombinase